MLIKYLSFHLNDQKALWIMSKISVFKGSMNIFIVRQLAIAVSAYIDFFFLLYLKKKKAHKKQCATWWTLCYVLKDESRKAWKRSAKNSCLCCYADQQECNNRSSSVYKIHTATAKGLAGRISLTRTSMSIFLPSSYESEALSCTTNFKHYQFKCYPYHHVYQHRISKLQT